MTYCVGILLDQGLVLASDTRTNAGVDQVAITPKMHVFETKGNRMITVLTAGNLAITQSVVNILRRNIQSADVEQHVMNADSMFDVATLVGNALREVYARDGKSLKEHDIEFSASLLVAGQIKGEAPRLFNVYSAGNFIESTHDTPFLQIGATKYGKPILDRVIDHDTEIMEAVKCVLISFDSTIRSNVSVAAPIDLMIYRKDTLNADCRERITEQDAYYTAVKQGWAEGLKQVFVELPNPDWCVD
jgi:putative proteasome-type protease